MRKLIFSAIIGLGALGAAPIAHAQTDQFLGEVRDFGFDFCPTGWYQTNGQLLPISTNTALFSLLGTLYGGDGTTTFALPTLAEMERHRLAAHAVYRGNRSVPEPELSYPPLRSLAHPTPLR